MGSLLNLSHLLLFFVFLVFFVDVLFAGPSASFGVKDFGGDLGSLIGFYGDAKVDGVGSFVELTRPSNFSAGRVMYKKPIKLLGKNDSEETSFGTFFSFSLSPENGDGVSFVMLSKGFSSGGYNGKLFGLSNELIQKDRVLFAVEIDTKYDPEFGDLDANHVGINVGSLVSVQVTNKSDVKLGLSSGKTLQCWIDYEATSKRVEVRLSNAGAVRPTSPLLSCPIDLSKLFKKEEVFFGISSSNANSKQVCKLHSWSFKLRRVPYWMHSEPLDPKAVGKDAEPVAIRQKSDCRLKVLTALILGTACGALGAYIVMFVWSVFVTKKPVVPEEFVVKPVVYDYAKVDVLAVDKSTVGGLK